MRRNGKENRIVGHEMCAKKEMFQMEASIRGFLKLGV